MKKSLFLATALLAPGLLAAAPVLQVPSGLPGAPGRSVKPNVLLALSLTYRDARAAYGNDFDPQVTHDGYFNPGMCYRYRSSAGGEGYFVIAAPAGEGQRCDGTFSGNFLNWAATSRLDLLRLALTGGDRAIDRPGLTVLQRAVLPDGASHGPDFYAHPDFFPRRTLPDGAAFTPFGDGPVHVVSCRDRILFSRTATGTDCDAPRRGASGRLLVSDKRLGDYLVRVQACDEADAADRPWLCRPVAGGFKPQGTLQRLAGEARFGVMGYLAGSGSDHRNLYGGVLRAPLKLLAAETDGPSGLLLPDPDGGATGLSGTINYINRSGRDGRYKAWAPTAELYYEALRYLQGRAGSMPVPRHDAGFPVWAERPDPATASCQRNTIALIAHPAADEDRYVPGNRVASHMDRPRAAERVGTGAWLDVAEWTERAGRVAGIAGLATAQEGAGGTGSSYIAGLALWAASHPLRGDGGAALETVVLQLGSPAGRRTALGLAGSVAAGGLHLAVAPAEIVPALRAALARAVRPGGEVASTAVALRQPGGGMVLLRTTYDPAAWAGDLERIDVAGGGAGRSAWRASARLPAHQARRIHTTVASAGATATIPFTYAALPRGLFADPKLVDYLRGDRSREGQGLRVRGGPLADMVRSEPVVVRPPSSGGFGESYLRFTQRHRDRATVAYVGANNGMLHAFDLDTGAERFAYVPRLLLPGLVALAQPGYRHQARLDASAGTGDARIAGEWATVLASGFGMGAKGVFAIDVTDPDDFARGRGELWQFTERDDAMVGHIHARPAIARFRTGSGGTDNHRYFAVISSGINNYGEDDKPDGALFLLSLDKRGPGAWRRGTDYHRIVAPAAQADRPNALGPATLVPGADGTVRLAYAGDLQGNLWRFDFTRPPPWPGQASLLFSARPGGVAQPITSAPAVVHAPGGYLVLFGTGRLVEDADLDAAANAPQSFYAVLDVTGQPAAPVARAQLAPRSLAAQGGAFRVTGRDIDYGRDRGWYFDYAGAAATGERSVASPLPAGGSVIVRTIQPPDDPCDGPSGRTYVLDALTGLSPRPGSFTAELTGHRSRHRSAVLPAALMTWNGPVTPAGAGATRATGNYAFFPIDGLAPPDPIPIELPARRVSWREIPNWEDLHRAAGNQQEEP